jgi:hypothetical protein
MATFHDCRILRAGPNDSEVYVFLQTDDLTINNYYALDSSQAANPKDVNKNQLLATALTALSLDLPVSAALGVGADPKTALGHYYCTALYVRRDLG